MTLNSTVLDEGSNRKDRLLPFRIVRFGAPSGLTSSRLRSIAPLGKAKAVTGRGVGPEISSMLPSWVYHSWGLWPFLTPVALRRDAPLGQIERVLSPLVVAMVRSDKYFQRLVERGGAPDFAPLGSISRRIRGRG